jgi:hypothetical protein
VLPESQVPKVLKALMALKVLMVQRLGRNRLSLKTELKPMTVI